MNNRQNIIEERLKRYARIARDVAQGKRGDREAYIRQKNRYVVPPALRALQKIKEGTATICDACGETIPPERIKAVPGAIYCIECQAKKEKATHRQ